MFRSSLYLLVWVLLLLPQLQAKVLVLTSLDDKANRPPLRLRSWSLNQKLENIAKKRLKEFDFEIHHHVTQVELHQHLRRDDISALIWISHSSGAISRGGHAFSNIQIFDYQNRNLAPMFYHLPNQLQFFALVGCQSQHIFQSWENDPNILLRHPHDLEVFLEKKKVDARRSLKRAIKQLRSSQGLHSDFDEDKDEDEVDPENLSSNDKLELKIQRLAEKSDGPSARLMFKDQVLAVFPEIKRGQTQFASIVLEFEESELSSLKLILESGGGARELSDLGRLEIETTEGGVWKLFARPDGTPIGIGTHIYRYQQ